MLVFDARMLASLPVCYSCCKACFCRSSVRRCSCCPLELKGASVGCSSLVELNSCICSNEQVLPCVSSQKLSKGSLFSLYISLSVRDDLDTLQVSIYPPYSVST
jgi:hypothetical protein